MTTWRSEVAASLRKAAATLRGAKAMPPEQSWSYDDKSAPKTPWGRAQGAYNIAPGVRWFHTPGHGGLMVSKAVSQKLLSDAARKLAEFWGGNYWFEEDIQYAIAFFEHPEWGDTLVKIAGGSQGTKESYEAKIRQYFPKYFELQQSGFKMPEKLKVGDVLEFKQDVNFNMGHKVKAGDRVVVDKLTGTYIIFTHNGVGFKLGMKSYNNGLLVKVAA